MDDYHISRSYLESLTTGELTALAESRGIDIPPELERGFIIGEILDAFFEVFLDDFPNNDFPPEKAAAAPERKGFSGPVPLPDRYNITYIEIIVRDPLWVYVFWEIKDSDREALENDAAFQGYYLKVSPLGKCTDGDSFVVAVGNSDLAWYLGFSPESVSGGAAKTNDRDRRFRVELYARLGEVRELLAASRPFSMPRLLGVPGTFEEKNQARLLSGLEELPILRSGERSLRSLSAAVKPAPKRLKLMGLQSDE
jgi:hypothetical protein